MSGHGHVTPNANGLKARCGGPGICNTCAQEFVRQHYKASNPEPEQKYETVSDTPVADMTLASLVFALHKIHNLGDAIYRVRSSAAEGDRWRPWEGNSWQHPAVERYGDLWEEIENRLKAEGLL